MTTIRAAHFPLAIAGILVGLGSSQAAELTVGPGKTYATPSLAATACLDGDTISIDAGLYTGDVCTWSRSNLTIRGVGGKAHLEANGLYAAGKGTWVLAGNNTTVENIEFSGATASATDNNGAGIRLDGTGLTVRSCFFHDNQNGILTGANAASDVLIEYSEFANNGFGDGYTHNLYIGQIRTLTFRFNYSHHAKAGHNLKSRAQSNYVIGNRLMDEANGTSSYVVDLPNGGLSFLIGNLIQQGPATANHSAIIRYGEEGGTNTVQHLYVCSNTVVNDYPGTTSFLTIAATTTVAQVRNNLFLGQGTAISGTATLEQNNLVTTTSPLVNRATYDYHLATGTNAAVDAAVDPGSAEGQALLPTRQYVHPASDEARTTNGSSPDIGAYERAAASGGTTTGGSTTGAAGTTTGTGSTTSGGTTGSTGTTTGASTGSTNDGSSGGGCAQGGLAIVISATLATLGLRHRHG